MIKPKAWLGAAALAALLGVGATAAHAQFGGPMLPLVTTIVVEKPAPDQGYGNQKVIYIGVKEQTYKFILRDAYVDDPSGRWFWIDIWKSVEQFRPNFQVQGQDASAFEKIKPGETVTINGMYSMTTRTFEVTNVSPGTGPFGEKPKY